MSSGPIATLALALVVSAAACKDDPALAGPAVQPAQPAPPAPRLSPTRPAPAAPSATSPAAPGAAETCADAWLAAHELDALGDAEPRSYPGGTPLFDERTGLRTDRVSYLFAKRADLRAACTPPTAAGGALTR